MPVTMHGSFGVIKRKIIIPPRQKAAEVAKYPMMHYESAKETAILTNNRPDAPSDTVQSRISFSQL